MLDDSLNAITEKLIRETVPQTVRLRVSVAQTVHAPAVADVPSHLSVEQIYIETAQGQRYFDERRILPEGRVSHVSSYCDGSKSANVRFSPEQPDRQTTITVGRDFMNESDFGFRDAPEPLRYYHVGLTPLHEAIQHAEPMGQESVIGRTCKVFHFKDVGPPGRKQSLVYSLDEATSVPLKIAAYARPEQISAGVPNWVWEATTLDAISGRHYPLRSNYGSFRLTQDRAGHWTSMPHLSRTIEASEVTFDDAIPKSAFWPTLQPGVFVLDAVAKKKYHTPGGPPAKQETSTAASPIRVAPESGSWLPGIGVALSLAVLAVAALLWMRSR